MKLVSESFEEKILEYLQNHPNGATIVTMSEEIEPSWGEKASKNTIRKYVKKLYEEKKLQYRKVGNYKLYYIAGTEFNPHIVFKNFYMGILVWLKQNIIEIFGDKAIYFEKKVKQMGKDIASQYKMDLDVKKIKRAVNEI